MKLEVIPAPSAKDPRTLILRHVPENEDDEKAIRKADRLLTGMNIIHTLPTVKDKTCLSLMFTLSNKRAGAK